MHIQIHYYQTKIKSIKLCAKCSTIDVDPKSLNINENANEADLLGF